MSSEQVSAAGEFSGLQSELWLRSLEIFDL